MCCGSRKNYVRYIKHTDTYILLTYIQTHNYQALCTYCVCSPSLFLFTSFMKYKKAHFLVSFGRTRTVHFASAHHNPQCMRAHLSCEHRIHAGNVIEATSWTCVSHVHFGFSFSFFRRRGRRRQFHASARPTR